MPETLVIVPTYNELAGLEEILHRIRAAVPEAHVLVVDDASPDGTGRLADAIAERDAAISVLHRTGKDGLGKAYLAGFAIGLEQGYDLIVQLDADGSHPPEQLQRMLELARGGGDLVIGSRWVEGGAVRNWPRYRQAISRFGNAYSRTVLRSRIRDITAGYRVFRASTLHGLELESVASQGYCFQVELAWRVERRGGRVIEHPITFVERATGRSKMHAGIVAEALIRVTAWGIAATLKRSRR